MVRGRWPAATHTSHDGSGGKANARCAVGGAAMRLLWCCQLYRRPSSSMLTTHGPVAGCLFFFVSLSLSVWAGNILLRVTHSTSGVPLVFFACCPAPRARPNVPWARSKKYV